MVISPPAAATPPTQPTAAATPTQRPTLTIDRNRLGDLYLPTWRKEVDSAERLYKAWQAKVRRNTHLKPDAQALFDGYWALRASANDHAEQICGRGGLLHLVPR